MKVTSSALVLAGVKATTLDICEASYQGVNEQVLACPGGRIKITDATYGRPSDDRETCCANKKKCWVKPGDTCTVSALDWITKKCQDESECTLWGGMNGVLGDPCRKRHKFLNVSYECDYSTPVKTASFCEADLENRTDSIKCNGANEVITVQSATWGRDKDAYCCPFKQDGNCLAEQCSGSTDSTELMSSICNGQAGCSWDDSIADQIKDPCSDVFKYMSVEYACAVPAPPARQMNDSGFAGDFVDYSSDCLATMMAAYQYYNQVKQAISDPETHGKFFHNNQFNLDRHSWGSTEIVTSRMEMFKFNMVRWGKKMDANGCECPLATKATIEEAFDSNRPTDNVGEVEGVLEAMANNFTCKKTYTRAVTRKVKHAHQIVKGSSTGNAKLQNRMNRFNQF